MEELVDDISAVRRDMHITGLDRIIEQQKQLARYFDDRAVLLGFSQPEWDELTRLMGEYTEYQGSMCKDIADQIVRILEKAVKVV